MSIGVILGLENMPPVVPDLIVQIRHDSESWREIYTNVVKALESGVTAYSVLDPLSNSVSAFYAEERPRFHNGIAVSVPDELSTTAAPASDGISKE